MKICPPFLFLSLSLVLLPAPTVASLDLCPLPNNASTICAPCETCVPMTGCDLQPNFCLIRGFCYEHQHMFTQANGKQMCTMCDVTKSTSKFSYAPQNTPCNDGDFCNGPDRCEWNDHSQLSTCTLHLGDPCAGRAFTGQCGGACFDHHHPRREFGCGKPNGTWCTDNAGQSEGVRGQCRGGVCEDQVSRFDFPAYYRRPEVSLGVGVAPGVLVGGDVCCDDGESVVAAMVGGGMGGVVVLVVGAWLVWRWRVGKSVDDIESQSTNVEGSASADTVEGSAQSVVTRSQNRVKCRRRME